METEKNRSIKSVGRALSSLGSFTQLQTFVGRGEIRAICFLIVFLCPLWVFAQVGLESRINETIDALVRIINFIIIAFVVWAGFLIAKGDGEGFKRLIYGIVGLIVVNAARMIIFYFR